MTKIIINVVFLLIILFIISDGKIEFKPFKISLPGYMNFIAALCFGIGIIIVSYVNYEKGRKQGYKKGAEDAIELIENKILSKMKENNLES